jgi:signal transduction histidine kinase
MSWIEIIDIVPTSIQLFIAYLVTATLLDVKLSKTQKKAIALGSIIQVVLITLSSTVLRPDGIMTSLAFLVNTIVMFLVAWRFIDGFVLKVVGTNILVHASTIVFQLLMVLVVGMPTEEAFALQALFFGLFLIPYFGLLNFMLVRYAHNSMVIVIKRIVQAKGQWGIVMIVVELLARVLLLLENKFSLEGYVQLTTIGVGVFGLIWLVYMIRQQHKLTIQLEMQTSNLQSYATSVEDLYQDIRAYKHDMSNILLSLRFLLEEEEIERIQEFFDEHIEGMKGFDLSTYEFMVRVAAIKIDALKGLLMTKYQLTVEKGISMNILVDQTFDVDSVDTVDLCRMLGILIDNAIEASEEALNKQVNVVFSKEKNGWVISVSNGYNRDQFSLSLGMTKSSKVGNRGIGLKSLKKLVNKYQTVELETDVTDERVVQRLVIAI